MSDSQVSTSFFESRNIQTSEEKKKKKKKSGLHDERDEQDEHVCVIKA